MSEISPSLQEVPTRHERQDRRPTDAAGLDGTNRVMPRTANRAITCVIEGRRELHKAIQALEVAIGIFDNLPEEPTGPLRSVNGSPRSLARELTDLGAHLLGAEAVFDEVCGTHGWLR